MGDSTMWAGIGVVSGAVIAAGATAVVRIMTTGDAITSRRRTDDLAQMREAFGVLDGQVKQGMARELEWQAERKQMRDEMTQQRRETDSLRSALSKALSRIDTMSDRMTAAGLPLPPPLAIFDQDSFARTPPKPPPGGETRP